MKVKIKSWEDMEREFGIDSTGDIDCKGYFTTSMEKELPDDRIIELIQHSSNDVFYDWETETRIWTITDDMIEEVL